MYLHSEELRLQSEAHWNILKNTAMGDHIQKIEAAAQAASVEVQFQIDILHAPWSKRQRTE